MAKGKSCSKCNFPMFAKSEDHQDKGTWVVYVCNNGNCKFTEKVFEGK